jgi:hypothetical protein
MTASLRCSAHVSASGSVEEPGVCLGPEFFGQGQETLLQRDVHEHLDRVVHAAALGSVERSFILLEGVSAALTMSMSHCCACVSRSQPTRCAVVQAPRSSLCTITFLPTRIRERPAGSYVCEREVEAALPVDPYVALVGNPDHAPPHPSTGRHHRSRAPYHRPDRALPLCGQSTSGASGFPAFRRRLIARVQ